MILEVELLLSRRLFEQSTNSKQMSLAYWRCLLRRDGRATQLHTVVPVLAVVQIVFKFTLLTTHSVRICLTVALDPDPGPSVHDEREACALAVCHVREIQVYGPDPNRASDAVSGVFFSRRVEVIVTAAVTR
jgi:hypothetical protein